MAKSNGFGIVTSFRIGQPNAAKSPYKERRSTTIISALKRDGIV